MQRDAIVNQFYSSRYAQSGRRVESAAELQRNATRARVFDLAEMAGQRGRELASADRDAMRARIFQLADMAGKQGRKLTSADRNGTRAGIFNLAEMASLRRTTEHLDGRLKTCTFSEAQFQESFEGTADPDCDARPGNTDHLEIFFADYPSFHYNPFMPISAQYMALCLLYGFYRGEPDSNKAYAGFQRAMAQTFSDIFGSNVDDLGNLQSLCRLLGVDPIPGNIKECRKAVRGVHVNLVDLVDWGRMGSAIHRFETEQDLAEYTRTSQKYFPQGEAEGSLLQFLLRRII